MEWAPRCLDECKSVTYTSPILAQSRFQGEILIFHRYKIQGVGKSMGLDQFPIPLELRQVYSIEMGAPFLQAHLQYKNYTFHLMSLLIPKFICLKDYLI